MKCLCLPLTETQRNSTFSMGALGEETSKKNGWVMDLGAPLVYWAVQIPSRGHKDTNWSMEAVSEWGQGYC